MNARDSDPDNREPPTEVVRPDPEFDPDSHAQPDSDVRPFEVDNPVWSIGGVARIVGDEEELLELRRFPVV